MFKALLFALALIFIPATSYAQVKPVQDELALMTKKQNEDLTKYLLNHKLKILVITKASDNIEEDALKLGRSTGVDIVLWFSGKQVRVETGTRREGDLPDMVSDAIVRDNLKLLKEKKYYDFFHKVSDEIYKKTNTAAVETTPESDAIAYLMAHPWVLLIVVVLWLILLVICPDCAMFFVYVLLSSKSSSNSYSSGRGDFSGGGSTYKD